MRQPTQDGRNSSRVPCLPLLCPSRRESVPGLDGRYAERGRPQACARPLGMVQKEEPGPLRGRVRGLQSGFGNRYIAVVLTHKTRLTVTIGLTVAVTVPEVVTLVAGNHGGAKPPCKKRLSNQMFLVVTFPCLAWLAIRPPTIVSVLIWFQVLIKPPDPLLEIIASEASISRF